MTANPAIHILDSVAERKAANFPYSNRIWGALMGFSLALLTFVAFFGIWRNSFVEYDDATYIYQNPYVKYGFGPDTLAFAFNSGYGNNWHPLTWVSHALDCQLFGINAVAHHLVSLTLHVANVVLLFFLLLRLTRLPWPSAMVAALFGIHPLHVESVAWAAERKDVLSAFFFLLTLVAYTRYAAAKESKSTIHTPANVTTSPGRALPSGAPLYWGALLLFALGLMSKPMLVTLPFVLLLLDYWPLQRFELGKPKKLLLKGPGAEYSRIQMLLWEKFPFFLLSLVSCFLTVQAQGAAVLPFEAKPLPDRLRDAGLATVAYLRQTFWPANLSVFYPRPALPSPIGGATAVFLLVAISATLFWSLRRHRVFSVGWLWFLGMLVPVIGIVQVGSQAQADRYMYLPSIGLFILIVWGFANLAYSVDRRLHTAPASAPTLAPERLVGSEGEACCPSPRLGSPLVRWPMATGAGAVLAALVLLTQRQVAVWHDTETLFVHAVSATSNNYVAQTSLANLQLNRGRAAEALTNVEAVLQYAPHHPMAQYVAGAALQILGRNGEALPHFLSIPDNAGPELVLPKNARLAVCFLEAGRWADAQAALDFILTVRPSEPNALMMQAALLREQGHVSEAVQVFRQALERAPVLHADNPALNYELAELYALAGRTRDAAGCYEKTLQAAPQCVNALNNYAWMLATDADSQVRNGARAVELAERACRLTDWKQSVLMGSLAAAYAEANRFEDAVKMAERARDQASAAKLEDVARRNSELLQLYQAGKPYREPK